MLNVGSWMFEVRSRGSLNLKMKRVLVLVSCLLFLKKTSVQPKAYCVQLSIIRKKSKEYVEKNVDLKLESGG